MSNPTWPSQLPAVVLTDGHQAAMPDGVLRTQMEVGPVKSRRRFTAAPRPLAGRLVLTSVQLSLLDDFFVEDCQDGAIPFDWTAQRPTVDWDSLGDIDSLTDIDNLPFAELAASFRFVKPPTYRELPGGENYEVIMELEEMP